MILLFAVLVGLLAGLLRAWLGKRRLAIPDLRYLWLVPVALFPQWLVFQQTAARKVVPEGWAAPVLVGSQALLLLFIWFNRRQPGFWLLGLGLGLNLTVIALNGGLMPINPETVVRLVPDAPPGSWEVGLRLGYGKDIVLPVEMTRLEWLSDRFVTPLPDPFQVAFSLGDVLLAFGTILFFWAQGGVTNP